MDTPEKQSKNGSSGADNRSLSPSGYIGSESNGSPVANKGKWKKGKSGNPNGRPKGSINRVEVIKNVLEFYPKYSHKKEQFLKSVARRIAKEMEPDSVMQPEFSKLAFSRLLPSDRVDLDSNEKVVINLYGSDGSRLDLSKI